MYTINITYGLRNGVDNKNISQDTVAVLKALICMAVCIHISIINCFSIVGFCFDVKLRSYCATHTSTRHKKAGQLGHTICVAMALQKDTDKVMTSYVLHSNDNAFVRSVWTRVE